MTTRSPAPSTRTPDAAATILAAATITATGALFFNLMPLIVGAAAERWAWDQTQLGLFASAGLAGTTLATLTAPLWIRRCRWKVTIRAASITAGLGWALLSRLDAFLPIVSCAFIVGIAVAIAYAPALACLSDAKDPDRAFGVTIAAQVLLAAAIAAMLPSVLTHFGIEGVFLTLGVASASPVLLAVWVPDRGRTREIAPDRVEAVEPSSNNTIGIVIGLAGFLFFYAAVVGVWGFLELIGNDVGVTDSQVTSAITSALVVGVVGAFAAAVISKRISHPVAIAVGSFGLILSFVAIEIGEGFLAYLLAVIAMNAFWNFSISYQIGLVSVLDVSGRFTVLVTASQSIGGVIGPILAGAVATGQGYTRVIGVGIVLTLMSLVCYLAAVRWRVA